MSSTDPTRTATLTRPHKYQLDKNTHTLYTLFTHLTLNKVI